MSYAGIGAWTYAVVLMTAARRILTSTFLECLIVARGEAVTAFIPAHD